MSRGKRSAKTLRKKALKKTVPPQALLEEALRHQAAGQGHKAEVALRRVLEADPGNLNAHVVLASILVGRGENKEARTLCRRVTELQPKNAEAHNNLGKVLALSKNIREAAEAFRKAVELDPGLTTAHFNLGTLLKDSGKPEQAIASLERAVEYNSGFTDAWINLGVAQEKTGHFDKAEASFRNVLELDPGYNEARYNLAHMYQHSHRMDEAISVYRQTIENDPSHILAHHNLGLTLLTTGQMKEGWEEYEWRWRVDGFADRPILFPQPALENYLGNGSPLSGKTILVWAEQGIGDELQFAGMIPDLMESGGHIILECEPRLAPLFKRSFPGIEVVAKSDPPDPALISDDIDFQVSIGRLCRFLRADLASFPAHEGYLQADPDRTRELRERYQKDSENFLVGISWGSADKRRPGKSIPLSQWRPLLEARGVTFIDLQYGDTAAVREAVRAETGIGILHDETIDPLVDLDGFAAQVAAMDLTVSICNSTIFMAGALGVPGWVLVPFESSWIWCLGKEDNSWFPSLRLFSQERFGDWESVMANVAVSLRQKAGTS